MSRRERVLGEHREARCAAAAANKATSIALVGSVARGDDEPDSDYDAVRDPSDDEVLAGLTRDRDGRAHP